MKLAAAGGATMAAAPGAALAAGSSKALAGSVSLKAGGQDFSPITGKERKAIPTACWGCVTRDSMIGFVEDGRLVKLEGHPGSIRTEGVLCAKGQAGINQVYFPDRILYPLKRMGKRGEHKWKRISWDEALDTIAAKLKPLRDAGKPEQFMYAYGRHKASQWAVTGDFLAAYGTKTIGNHTSVCEGSKWVGQESLWGGMYDNWDYDKTDFVVNFGSNQFETHTNHIPTSHRLIRAMVDRGVPLYTFDVRLSNTAAKSNEWIPIKPGMDGLVMLAMCNVIMNEGLFRTDHLKYMRVSKDYKATDGEKIDAIKREVAAFTPEFASKESGVPADKIREIARGFAKANAACLVTYRGTCMHYHGADQERAAMLLSAITNNLDTPGGRVMGVGGSWSGAPSSKKAEISKGLHIKDGFPGEAAFPTHHVSQSIIPMIIDGSFGRPDVYWWSCYNPAYINGNNDETRKAFQDESIFPFLITTTITYDESSQYADIILPDVTYLERWDWEDMVDAAQIGENYIRQPLIKPLGEARCQGDVWPELAKRLGFELAYSSKKDFVKQTCDNTPGVKESGGFDYMVKHGVWVEKDAKPKYGFYKEQIDVSGDGVILDDETGVYWNHKNAGVSEAEAKSKGYLGVAGAKKHYVAQHINGEALKAYPPNTKFVKSGLLDFYSDNFAEKGFPAFPTYTPIPEHQEMGEDDLVLTTYKVAVHTHSRTAQCKWLSEIKHDNPAWINSKTASDRGIQDGDAIKVKSNIGEITTTAHVTEGIVPGIIAISYHLGREHSGIFASGNRSPSPGGANADPDAKNKWWNKHGVHPNKIIPNSSDPISGGQRWMDTVVQVSKA